MGLEQVLREASKRIRSNPLSNEEQVKQRIILPVLRALEWDDTTGEVEPQFKADEGKPDYALCQTKESPLVFIEAKKLGEVRSEAEKQLFGVVRSEAEKQLFKYNSKENVSLLVLTDGNIWNLYFRRADGDLTKRNFIMRKFYHMELSREEKIPEYASALEKYLYKDRVSDGRAQHEAEKRDETLDGIRHAWESLLKTPDDMLYSLLVKQVRKGGTKPNPTDVKEFLKTAAINSGSTVLGLAGKNSAKKKKTVKTAKKKTSRERSAKGKRTAKKGVRATSSPAKSNSTQKRKSSKSTILGFILDGKEKNCRSGIQTLAEVLREFQRRDAGFAARFAPKTVGTKKRLVARDRDDLRRDSSETDHFVELENGWWMETQRGKVEILKYIKTACEVAGVQFGSQLTLIER